MIEIEEIPHAPIMQLFLLHVFQTQGEDLKDIGISMLEEISQTAARALC